MKPKKVLCLVVAFLLAVQLLPVYKTEVTAEENSVVFSMEDGGVERGMRGFFQGGKPSKTVKYQGKDAWVMQGNGTELDKTIYFTLGDAFRKSIDGGTGVEISVEYYDTGTGFFSMVYDAVYDETEDPVYAWSDTRHLQAEPGKFAGFVNLKNTNLWQTKTFYIRDQKFLKRLANESDFYISLDHKYMGSSKEDVAIASVTVKAMDTKSPARVFSTSDSIGNIFFSDTPVEFSTDIISVVNYDFEGEIIFSALDINDVGVMYEKDIQPLKLERDGTLQEKYILQQKREPLKLKAGETITKQVSFDLSKYGLMTYRVELVSADNTMYTVYDKAFSRVSRTSDEPLNQNFGMSMHYFMGGLSENINYADTGYALLERAGISWIRGDLRWDTVEKSLGSYQLSKEQNNFMGLNVDKYGGKFHIYPIINSGNGMLGGDYSDLNNLYKDNVKDAFANYVKASAGLLQKDQIDTLEMINEPNLGGPKPDIYADMMETVTERVKAEYPDIKLAGPATSETPVMFEHEYIPQLFANGGLDNLDIVAVHPYNWRFAPEFSGKVEALVKLRELCVEYGKPDIEIWGTESGYPTGCKNPQLQVIANDTGEIGQAAWMARFFIMTQAEHTLDKMFVYTMHDGPRQDEPEHRFGLCRGIESAYEPFIAKAGLVAASTLSTMTADMECIGKLNINNSEILAYRWTRPEQEQTIALWTTNRKDSVALSLGVNEIQVYDMYGNAKTLHSKDGIYDFVLDGTVTYLTGNFTDFTQVDSRLGHESFVYSAVPGDVYEYQVSSKLDGQITIKADAGSVVELVDEPQRKENGKFVGSFKLKEAEASEINLEVYDGDQLYSTIAYMVEPTDAVDIVVESCTPYNENSLNRWGITFLITNHRNSSDVEGYIKLKSPDYVVSKLSNIRVSAIPPGSVKRVMVYLPEMNRKYKEELSGVFYMNDGTEQFFSVDVDFTVGKRTSVPPTLDGVVSDGEWTRGTWLYMDRANQVVQNVTWRGAEDLSGRANLMWDDENLYLATVVTDDIFGATEFEDDRTWANDSLQIGLKSDMSTGVGNYNEFTISLNRGKASIYRNKAEGTAKVGVVTNFQGKIVRDDEKKTTTYELAIPWEELVVTGFKIVPDLQIAFSMMINENDGVGRNGWIELTPGIGYEKDPRLFTKILLVK